MECVAYCLARQFDIKALRMWMRDHFQEVECLRESIYAHEQDGGDFFCFNYGAIVFWSVEPQRQQEIINHVLNYCIEPLASREEEEFTFRVGDSFKIEHEEIILNDRHWKTKLALSHAFAQSVKLEVFENRVESMMEQSHKIVTALAQQGRIKMSRKETAKQLGRLIQERSSVHLYCDVLDTPDFFWECSELQPYYEETVNYLDLSSRLQVLHRRLDIIRDTLDILSSELNHLHAAFLEWIIIVLILIEVLVTLVTFLGVGHMGGA